MEDVLDSLAVVDAEVKDLFIDEGITDFDTFFELNEADFARLRLKTKVIKTIQRIQNELRTDPIVEELEMEEQEENAAELEDNEQNAGNDEMDVEDETYEGILLEEEINIDRIFRRTRTGKGVMEALKEGLKPTDGCLKTINNILCDYLKSTYGLRPSSYHKNVLAVSLVKTYPALASSNVSVPQALWFHPHARGVNKHSGRVHYHMEYLVRKSGERLINRQRTVTAPGSVPIPDANNAVEDQIEEMREELKFICPGPATKARSEELWLATFKDRQNIRQTESLICYLKDHPVGSAFNGELISIEFHLLNPTCLNFSEKFQALQGQILAEYGGYYRHVTNDFLRTLAIIRMKNPSRGAKRLRESNAANDNPLHGIMEWYQDDDLPPSRDVPVLQFKGDMFADNCDGHIIWKDWNMCIRGDFAYCFRVLVESYAVINVSCRPSDKQFFLFISALMGIGTLTTTGEKFMRSVK